MDHGRNETPPATLAPCTIFASLRHQGLDLGLTSSLGLGVRAKILIPRSRGRPEFQG